MDTEHDAGKCASAIFYLLKVAGQNWGNTNTYQKCKTWSTAIENAWEIGK